MRINRNNGNKSLKGLKQGQGQGLDHKDQDKDKDLTHKDKDLTPKDQDKDKDLTPKDQDKDKDLKNVFKESLRTRTRTRTRINIPDSESIVNESSTNKQRQNRLMLWYLVTVFYCLAQLTVLLFLICFIGCIVLMIVTGRTLLAERFVPLGFSVTHCLLIYVSLVP